MNLHFSLHRRGSRQRCGFLLPSILILLTVLFLLAMTRNFFSRQQLNMAGHLRDHELAYQMAASGMTVGAALFVQAMDFLNDSRAETYPKRDKVPAAIKPIIHAFLDNQGLPYTNGASLIVDNNFIKEYCKEAPEARGVQLTMEMRRKDGLFKAIQNPGFQVDDREVSYEFFIHSEGKYGASSARVTTFFEGRFVNILPPVLGKFSLFIREQPVGGVNQFIDSESPALIKNAPLTVTSGELAAPNSLSSGKVKAFFETQGWVYLGGLVPWRLSVSLGGGIQSLSECFLRSNLFLFPIPNDQVLGKIPGLSFCAAQWRLCQELREDSKKQVLVLKEPADETSQTSLLHLFGSTQKPSPTVVFGNASRRWLLMQGLKSDSDPRPACFPFLDSGTFSSSKWPGDDGKDLVSKTIKKHFNNSFEAYSKKMSDIFEEDINASNLYALKMDDTDASSSPILYAEKVPAAFAGCRTSDRMNVNNSPADYLKLNVGSIYELKNSAGKILFSGGDLGRIQDLSFLERKAGFVFENEKDFWKAIPRKAGTQIQLGGVTLIKGDLTISNPLVISSTGGGMILCTGTVWIKSSIQCLANQPLSIVSLTKDIWVETTTPVNAALIALGGVIHLPKECVINGLVAAKLLDLPMGSPDRKREINYQTRFDPTDAENYLRNYRMMISSQRFSFVH